MKLLNVDYVRAYDWEAIYVLGKKYNEGHSIDWLELLMSNVVHIRVIKEADELWLAEVGEFPENLSEVKFAS